MYYNQNYEFFSYTILAKGEPDIGIVERQRVRGAIVCHLAREQEVTQTEHFANHVAVLVAYFHTGDGKAKILLGAGRRHICKQQGDNRENHDWNVSDGFVIR